MWNDKTGSTVKIRSGILVVLMATVMLGLTGCNKLKQIRVTSFDIEAVSPQGLRSLNVFVAVGVDNPAFQIGLSEIEGTLKYSGKIIGKLAMDPFTLQAKSAEIYHLKALVSLAEGAGLRDLAVLMDQEALNECLVDIQVRPELKSGLAKTITLKDIPLKKLL